MRIGASHGHSHQSLLGKQRRFPRQDEAMVAGALICVAIPVLADTVVGFVSYDCAPPRMHVLSHIAQNMRIFFRTTRLQLGSSFLCNRYINTLFCCCIDRSTSNRFEYLFTYVYIRRGDPPCCPVPLLRRGVQDAMLLPYPLRLVY